VHILFKIKIALQVKESVEDWCERVLSGIAASFVAADRHAGAGACPTVMNLQPRHDRTAAAYDLAPRMPREAGRVEEHIAHVLGARRGPGKRIAERGGTLLAQRIA
jgi:hypothetical protein